MPRHYDHAPIVEAILDIQVKVATSPDQSAFAQLSKELSSNFSQAMDLSQVRLNVGVPSAGTAPSFAHTVVVAGLRLASSQNDRVLQLLPRGMTYSHLQPYSNWDIFRSEAVPLWQRYVEVMRPEAVTRVALRYINRIWIPEQRFELSDYFHLDITLPPTIPQDMSAFFTQIQLPQTDIGPDLMAVINFSTAGRREDDAQGIVLDLDVFAARVLTPSLEVFSLLDLLRDRKNALFEACITDKARELFK
jgi:uncharacterized protein (TIGR04255 family)